MHGVCQAVCWFPIKIASLSDHAETVKSTLSCITSAIRFIQGIPNELPNVVNFCRWAALLKSTAKPVQQVADRIISVVKPILPVIAPVYNTLEVVKEYLTFLEFFANAKARYNLADGASYTKAAELNCKLVYSGLDTFLLIPDKLKWIDLASLIGKSAAECLAIGKGFFVLGTSALSIWNASKSIDKAKEAQVKDKERNLSLKQIQEGPDNQISARMRNYLGITDLTTRANKSKNKTEKLVKTYGTILDLRREIRILNQEIENLQGNPNPNCAKIADLSETLEGKKSELENAHQKVKRCVYFYREATGIDLSIIAQNMGIIHDDLLYLQQLTPLPYIKRDTVEHVVDYKIKKNSVDIVENETQEAKSKWKIIHEVTKIAMVSCAIFLAMIPATFATAAAAIGFGMWVGSFALCLATLGRLVFETFYDKGPKASRPITTELA